MSDVQLKLNESKRGLFFIEEGKKRIAEMVISIDTLSFNNILTFTAMYGPNSR